MLLICRFDVAPPDEASFTERARHALALLTRAPGCLHGQLSRAIEEPSRWVLTVQFSSASAYRRALSPFEVREQVVPLLALALVDQPTTYETLAEAESGAVTDHLSLLAPDRARPRSTDTR